MYWASLPNSELSIVYANAGTAPLSDVDLELTTGTLGTILPAAWLKRQTFVEQ
jgi:hypothetical protein